MRNLKKALVLVLTLAMMLSIMVVGAGAVFTDQNKIDTKHQQAVDACVSLNIINGMSDGSFDPQGIVTREQMTKMICILMNGGNEPVVGDTTSIFTDVSAERWSAPYIASCVKQGIVAGVGDNKFNPTGNLTATQCAKMLLVALGYNQDMAGYTGPNWAVNVNVDASAKGFYKSLEDIDPNAGMSREHAAEMIWNALNADEVEYSNTLTTDANGQLVSKTSVKDRTDVKNNKITLMEDKYSTKNFEDEILLSVKEDAKGTFSLKTWGFENGATVKSVKSYSKVATDCTPMLGMEVDVMQKTTGDKDVMGVYATDNNPIAVKSTVGQVDTYKPVDKTIKIDGTKYTVDNANIVYTTSLSTNASGVAPGADIATALVNGDTPQVNTASDVYAVSNDGDNKIDAFIIIPAQGAKVTYVGSDNVTLNNNIGTLDAKDYSAYAGMAKNDWVVYTPSSTSTYNLDSIVKMDIVSGTIEATKGSSGDVDAKINGTYYSKGTDFNGTDPRSNDSVNAAVYAGRYYDLDAVANPTSSDILFIIEANKIQGGINNGLIEAYVLLADGTKQSMIIDEIYPKGNSSAKEVAATKAALVEGNEVNYTNGTDGTVYVGAMYTYTKDGSKYDLYPLTASDNDQGYDKGNNKAFQPMAGKYTEKQGLIADFRVADDALIFVSKNMTGTTGASAKVLTGKQLKSWGSDWGKEVQILCLDKNGSSTVQVACLYDVGGYASESSKYGIVNSKPEVVTLENKRYGSFDMWTGSSASGYVIDKTTGLLSKGTVIKYELDGTVADVPKIDNTSTSYIEMNRQGAMLAVSPNGSKWDVSVTDSTGNKTTQVIYQVDEDTTVMYINDDVGVAGDKASMGDYLATESAVKNTYICNVIYEPKDANTLDLLVIDVRGQLGTNGALKLADKYATGISNIDLSGKTITISGDSIAVSAITKSLKNVLVTDPASGSVNAGASITIVATNGDSAVFKVVKAATT